MDKGKIPITIFLDLSKAFDTFNYDILHTNCHTMVLKDFQITLFKVI